MHLLEQLFEAKRTERVGRVVRRVSMLIVFIQVGTGFSAAGRNYGCDRRTVSMWWMRFCEGRKTPAGIKSALSDRPRTGRPPKIKREILEEARRWCEGRAFTPAELRAHLEKMSGVRLSLVQTRRYAKRWHHSQKKDSPIKINRSSRGYVRVWRHRLFKRLEELQRLGYAIATQDEAIFRDAALSIKYWSKIGLRIFLPWSGGFSRFTMLCTMTLEGRIFLNYADAADGTSFMAHISRVYEEVGKMVLVLDRAPWHKSIAVQEFLAQRDIIIIWYPVGHPYLNPVEEVWSVLKGSVDRSIRYADVKSHLTAIFNHVKESNGFDYDFAVFWRRSQPKGVMRSIVRVEGDLAPEIVAQKVPSTRPKAGPAAASLQNNPA